MLGGHAIAQAVQRAGVDPAEVDDVLMGCALQQGSSGFRQSALRAGLPATVAGMSIDRQCASGLMAIATAAKEIVVDGLEIAVAGGPESISLVQNEHYNSWRVQDPWLVEHVAGCALAAAWVLPGCSRSSDLQEGARARSGISRLNSSF